MRTREHFRFTRDLVRKQSYNDLYHLFSPRLRGEVLACISMRTLQAVPYFVKCERQFLNALSQRLSHHGYAQGEIIDHGDEGGTLSIVTRGTAVRGGKPITLYQYWGDDMIVSSRALRDRRPASALTYVEIVCLTRDNLDAELANFPISKHTIHIAAVSIAMMRAPVLITDYLAAVGRPPADLFGAMKRLGTQSNAEDKELQAVLKAINDSKPLRGFARELMHEGDETLKKKSTAAVVAMHGAGDESKMLVDETGHVVTDAGDPISVEEEESDNPVLKAIEGLRGELKQERASERAELTRELVEIKHAIFALLDGRKAQTTGVPTGIVPNGGGGGGGGGGGSGGGGGFCGGGGGFGGGGVAMPPNGNASAPLQEHATRCAASHSTTAGHAAATPGISPGRPVVQRRRKRHSSTGPRSGVSAAAASRELSA